MKKDIHPDYHEITVEMTNGEKFKTRSTYGTKGCTLKLDIDPTTHPAWTGGKGFINENVSKVADFQKKFGAINFGTKAAPKPTAEQKEKIQEKLAEVKAEAKEEEAAEAEAKAEAAEAEAKQEEAKDNAPEKQEVAEKKEEETKENSDSKN